MKAKTIGYYKNVQNVGDVNAAVDLKVGMGVVLNRAARTANLPASEEEAKACFRIVSNINDKPEMRNFEETLTVKAGEKVRVNLPMTLVQVGLQMGMQMPQVTGGSAAEAMKSIDIEQIFKLVEQGVIGKLVEVESADGDTVEVFVE